MFFKHWKKNYWDINHLQYWSQCYEVRRFILKILSPLLAPRETGDWGESTTVK